MYGYGLRLFLIRKIFQAQGDGDLKAVVAQSTHDQKIRGLIRSNDQLTSESLETLFGKGRLVLTVEPDNTQPYLGIVPLQGRNLAAALQTYFEQSEQLKTRLWLFANESHVAGLLLMEQYIFDSVDLETLFSQKGVANQSETRH